MHDNGPFVARDLLRRYDLHYRQVRAALPVVVTKYATRTKMYACYSFIVLIFLLNSQTCPMNNTYTIRSAIGYILASTILHGTEYKEVHEMDGASPCCLVLLVHQAISGWKPIK